MIRAKPWNGRDLKGTWEFTLKIDGVRAFYGSNGWISRNGKPLYNIPTPYPDDTKREQYFGIVDGAEGFEVYCSKPGRSSKDNYKATIQCVRAKTKDRPIRADELYSLDPLDERLHFGPHRGCAPCFEADPTAETILKRLDTAIFMGFEGLVLRQGDHWLKVKPIETYDVPVTGIIEGTGKHKGRMGALMTPMGKVGTGFTDAEREWFWANTCPAVLRGDPLTIEVECMQLTPGGKFRHPRFARIRYDK